MLFIDDAAVAVSTRIVLLASFVSTVAGFAVVVAVVVVVAGSVAVYELISSVASSVNSAVVVTTLGGNIVRVVVFSFRAVVLDAVITVFTAAIFVLSVFSHHFFLLFRLPCPGPGMLSVETERNRKKLVDWCWVLYDW
jgi:hypothetical protein